MNQVNTGETTRDESAYLVLPSFPTPTWLVKHAQTSVTEFYRVLPSFTEFYRVVDFFRCLPLGGQKGINRILTPFSIPMIFFWQNYFFVSFFFFNLVMKSVYCIRFLDNFAIYFRVVAVEKKK